MNLQKHRRIIISGGGTGGHIFPAISIANALVKEDPGIEILFAGADGRMEMEKVPAAGYRIIGLPVSGFHRSLSFKNFKVLWQLFKSLRLAAKVIRGFKPDVVVGVGGYASGPVLWQAGRMGVPTLIQEQNSYAGVTNRLLARRAKLICVAYEGMERYFPLKKIIKTGNPVRQNFEGLDLLRDEALRYFSIDGSKPVVLVLGGSLGAGTINSSLSGGREKINASGCRWIWQTGRYYYPELSREPWIREAGSVILRDFIERMDLAFAAADVIISRAGAGTISELCLVGKPVILVPSPNVAEDHQTRNAQALTEKGAAVLIADADAKKKLIDEAVILINDRERKMNLSANISRMADRNADITIAREVLKLIEK